MQLDTHEIAMIKLSTVSLILNHTLKSNAQLLELYNQRIRVEWKQTEYYSNGKLLSYFNLNINIYCECKKGIFYVGMWKKCYLSVAWLILILVTHINKDLHI